jgi:hypothetical protein
MNVRPLIFSSCARGLAVRREPVGPVPWRPRPLPSGHVRRAGR